MDIGNILTRAWQITSQNKALWVFGFFAALSTSFGANSSQSGQSSQQIGQQMSGPDAAMALGIGCLALLAGIAVVLVSTMGRIGLVKGTLQVDAGYGPLTVGQLWDDSKPYFWRLIGLMLVLFGLALAFVLLTVVTLGTILIPILCCGFIVFPLLGAWLQMTVVSIVADDVGPVDALKNAWRAMSSQWLAVYLLALMVFVLLFAVVAVVGLLAALIIVPVLAFLGPAGALLAALIAVPLVAVAAGLVETYVTAAWTLAYTRLTGGPALSTDMSKLPGA